MQVTINGQPGPRLSGATLSGNEGPRQSSTIRDSGGGRSTVSVGGTTAAMVVEFTGINPSSVRQLEVLGGSVVLDTDEIVEGFDGDPKGPRFATFDASSGGVSFFRRCAARTTPTTVIVSARRPTRISMSTSSPAPER